MSELLSHWAGTSLGLCKDTLASQSLVTQPGSPEKSGRAGAGLGLRFTSHLDHSPAVLAATTCPVWFGMGVGLGVGVTFWDGPSQVHRETLWGHIPAHNSERATLVVTRFLTASWGC